MIKWTTPTLKCTIPSDLVFDYILLTLKQGNTVIEKEIQSSEVEEGVFNVFFTQEETGQLAKGRVEAQLNIMNGNTRLATNIVELMLNKNLHDEVIDEAV